MATHINVLLEVSSSKTGSAEGSRNESQSVTGWTKTCHRDTDRQNMPN